MRSVLALQMHPVDGTGYLEAYLRDRGVPMRLMRPYLGEPVPERPDGYAGIAVMGGPISVNDDSPMLRAVERLLAAAVDADVAVVGHCLGGQLLASALGARVRAADVVEIGWSPVAAAPGSSSAASWFGNERFTVFQWHYETFELPPSAELIATGTHCRHQAFAIGDRHIGMQFHCEITAEKIEAWLDPPGLEEIDLGRGSPAVQTAPQIRAATPRLIDDSRRVATRIYDRWLQHAAPGR